MNPIRYAITQGLLPVCLDSTKRMREKFASGYQKDEDKAFDRIWPVYKEMAEHVDSGYLQRFTKLILAVSDLPINLEEKLRNKLNKDQSIATRIFDPFTVIATANIKDAPTYIVLNGKNQQMLDITGKVGNYSASTVHLPEDDVVETTIETLTSQQLRYIMADQLFAMVTEPILNIQDEVEQEADPDAIPITKEETTKETEEEEPDDLKDPG